MLFRRGGPKRSLMVDIRLARQAAETGRADEVARRCRTALAAFDEMPLKEVDKSMVQTLDEFVDLCSEICRYDLARDVLHRLICLDPHDQGMELDLAVCYFELTEFEEAEDRLTTLARDCKPHPEIEWYLGALAERHGDFSQADRHFQQAHQLARKEFAPPLRILQDETDKLVEKFMDELPRDTFDALADVPVLLEPVPALQLLRLSDPPFSPLILGLHHGMNLRQGSVFHTAPTIDGIRLFPRNIEKVAWTHQQYEEQLAATFYHEVGHRLGLDEEDLWQRGL